MATLEFTLTRKKRAGRDAVRPEFRWNIGKTHHIRMGNSCVQDCAMGIDFSVIEANAMYEHGSGYAKQ